MQWDILFFFNSVLLGVGLAMDAFSVSLANGLNEPRMSRRRMLGIAGVFAGFQALMPMTGWICVHTIVQYFRAFEKLIPWIALALLGFIGGKMLWEAFIEDEDEGDGKDAEKIDLGEYLILAIATSIDALAVGISFAALSVDIVPAVSLIGITTFIFSVAGVAIGHTFGARYEKPATIVGGVVLILIGLKILLEHLGILVL